MVEVVRPILLGIVSVIGVVGHILTLLVLRALRQASPLSSKSLDATTHRLMVGEAWCDLLLCGIALPLSIWNRARGYVWPFTMPGVCYYKRVLQISLTQVSCYHILIIAILRCVVTFSSPHGRMKKALENGWVKIFISLIPWIFGYVSTVVGYAASAYRYAYSFFTINNCDLGPAGFTTASINKVMIFFAVDALLGVILPMIAAAIVQAIVLIKLHLQKRRALQRTHAGDGTVALNNVPGTGGAQRAWVNGTVNISTGNSTAASVQAQNVTTRQFSKTLALVCFVNLILLFPLTLAPMAGFTFAAEAKHPSASLILDFLFWSSFCIIPLMYRTFSSDMRSIYTELVKKVLRLNNKTNGNQVEQNPMSAIQVPTDADEKAL